MRLGSSSSSSPPSHLLTFAMLDGASADRQPPRQRGRVITIPSSAPPPSFNSGDMMKLIYQHRYMGHEILGDVRSGYDYSWLLSLPPCKKRALLQKRLHGGALRPYASEEVSRLHLLQRRGVTRICGSLPRFTLQAMKQGQLAH
ncbi:hypothetical protein ACP70R_020416 [Stipagrostis hirtigluma subsp. patula]